MKIGIIVAGLGLSASVAMAQTTPAITPSAVAKTISTATVEKPVISCRKAFDKFDIFNFDDRYQSKDYKLADLQAFFKEKGIATIFNDYRWDFPENASITLQFNPKGKITGDIEIVNEANVPNIIKFERSLEIGTTTKADVVKLYGEPNSSQALSTYQFQCGKKDAFTAEVVNGKVVRTSLEN